MSCRAWTRGSWSLTRPGIPSTRGRSCGPQHSSAAAPGPPAQPAVATRPGVLAERAGLLAFARECGLQAERIRPGALCYACPPFERHALEISGLAQAVPVTWRRGDLIEFRRTAAQRAARPAPAQDHAWREVMLNGAQIRFLDQPGAQRPPADPRLQHLAEGNVLASVSRRDPIRQHVAVWTASNRVFGCRTPRLLAVIAAALANACSVAPVVETHLGRHPSRAEQAFIAAATAQLAELARAETATSHTRHCRADSIGGLHVPAASDTARPGQITAGTRQDPVSARSAS